MPKKAGMAMISLGAVLIFLALLLFFYNQWEADMAGREAESRMADLENWRKEKQAESETKKKENSGIEETLDPEMPPVWINGYEYIGYLEIPALDLKLPLLSEWSYEHLKIAPCRQYGSSRTDDLVIAAHNYSTHFGRLKELAKGDMVILTDMDSISNHYAVAKIETLAPYDVDLVLNSAYDLTLYTCTVGGATRVVVYCDRTVPEA